MNSVLSLLVIGVPTLRYGSVILTGWVPFLRGDMGTSLRFNAPVTEVLANRSLNTLALMAVAWILSGIIGLLMGIVAGIKQGTLIDRIIKGYCFCISFDSHLLVGINRLDDICRLARLVPL